MKYRLALLGFLLLGQVANLVAILRMTISIIRGDEQGRVVALSFDQLGNSGLNGHEDETISSRAGRAARKGKPWGCRLCKCLDWFDKNHCEKSIEKRFLYLMAKREQRKKAQLVTTT